MEYDNMLFLLTLMLVFITPEQLINPSELSKF